MEIIKITNAEETICIRINKWECIWITEDEDEDKIKLKKKILLWDKPLNSKE